MLVCESTDACISVCTIAKSSIRHLSHPIPSVVFFPMNSLKDEGKLFVHSNPLKQVHIIYTSATKLLLAERLILLHLLSATDGNVIAIRGHRNIIMCKITDRPPPRSNAVMAQKMKTMQNPMIHHQSVSHSLGWMGQTRTLSLLHLSISSFCTALATTTSI
jgi:hypothetical protein